MLVSEKVNIFHNRWPQYPHYQGTITNLMLFYHLPLSICNNSVNNLMAPMHCNGSSWLDRIQNSDTSTSQSTNQTFFCLDLLSCFAKIHNCTHVASRQHSNEANSGQIWQKEAKEETNFFETNLMCGRI